MASWQMAGWQSDKLIKCKTTQSGKLTKCQVDKMQDDTFESWEMGS